MEDESKKERPEEFSFLREKIKERPVNKKRLLCTVGFVVLMAVLFGTVAAYTFTLVRPGAEEKLNPAQPDQVSFPEDEEIIPPNQEDSQEGTQEPVVIQEKVALELSDYQALFNKMSVLAAESSRSLVVVTSATSEEDWFNTLLESQSHGTGTVIADNSLEYLILTERSLVTGADRISVTFRDGTIHEAGIKSYDGNTGLAVLSVAKADLTEETKKIVSIAVLGNSNMVQNGVPIIAVGSPMEYGNETAFGNITSQGNYVHTNDANYKILTTDIIGSRNGSGVLLNMEGEIVGIISQEQSAQSAGNTIVAFAVSDLKGVIEKLSNGGEIAYMGIRGLDVTPSIAEASGMPRGVYAEVTMDSPAMLAGIQNGDIITAINNEPVENMKAIQNIMLGFEPEQALNLTVMRQGKDEYVEIKYVVTLGRIK